MGAVRVVGRAVCPDDREAGAVSGRPTLGNHDQGNHFTSSTYTALLRDKGVQIRRDQRGRAFDNIFTERLWRSVKYEEVYLHDYFSPREARQRLNRYF